MSIHLRIFSFFFSKVKEGIKKKNSSRPSNLTFFQPITLTRALFLAYKVNKYQTKKRNKKGAPMPLKVPLCPYTSAPRKTCPPALKSFRCPCTHTPTYRKTNILIFTQIVIIFNPNFYDVRAHLVMN